MQRGSASSGGSCAHHQLAELSSAHPGLLLGPCSDVILNLPHLFYCSSPKLLHTLLERHFGWQVLLLLLFEC